MWRCPNCGTQVDDGFQLCWSCGTASDGTLNADFHAEPDDPTVSDPGPEPELPKGHATDADAADADSQELVELCSAANVVEANTVCGLLEEAGIRAQIVGDFLGGAAGGLPLGESIAPRIWVLEDDVDHAREIVDRWNAERRTTLAEWPESDGPAEWETPAEPESEDAPLPSDERFHFLGQGFYIAGVVCILVSAAWAWKNQTILSKHSATVAGRKADASRRYVFDDKTYDTQFYVYVVDDKTYYAGLKRVYDPPSEVTILYDPNDPADSVIGLIAPPWFILGIACAVGVFFAFVGYQFR